MNKVEGIKRKQLGNIAVMQNPLKSVGMKLFLIFFSSIVVFVLAVGLLSYNISAGIIEKKMSESNNQTIIQAAGKLDLLFQTLEDTTMQIFLDKDIQKYTSKNNQTSDTYERLMQVQGMEQKLQGFLLANKTLRNIFMIPIVSGDTFQQFNAGSGALDREKAYASPWFQTTVKQDGRPVWIRTQKSGFNGNAAPSIGIARVLTNPLTGEKNYVVLLEIELSALRQELGDKLLGESGVMQIIDSTNKFISSADDKLLEQQSDIELPIDPKTNIFAASGTLHTDSKSGDSRLVAYKKFGHMDWYLVGSVPVSDLVKDAAFIRDITIYAALIAAVLAIGIGIGVVFMIGRPIGQLRNLMNEGEQGNLTVRTKLRRKDEIGQLGQSFNQMMDQITRLVQQTNVTAHEAFETAQQLSEVSKKTAGSAKEIAFATEEIAAGASSLASEAEKGTDLTQHISLQMKQVIDANLQMGASAGEVEQVSKQGTAYMTELIEKTNATEEMTRSMVEKVDRLKESTRSIRKILDVLNNMTKQTNILSLNATIEAARAGTAGKGFMVVADEIRKLAEQSRDSIQVVGQITETIQREIDETVDVLSAAYPIFQEQIVSVKEANSIFVSVQGQMGGLIQRLDGVTGSIQQLDQSQLKLSQAMMSVSSVAEQSSATSEEVASLCNEQMNIGTGLVHLSDKLDDVSSRLKESLSSFRV